MLKGNDMIVNLYTLPEYSVPQGVQIKQAFPGEMEMILEFVGKHYGKNWVGETRYALMQCPVKCFIAVQDKKVIGFSCYDASALGYFGPIGMEPGLKGKGIGKALLLRTLYAMKEAGYGYAIIGWVDEAQGFYRKTVNAEYIPGGTPDRTVYTKLTIF